MIWGDDIGQTNLSCYSRGLMGYQTPNFDRLAHEGMMFTDNYGEQSCTAGRSSFITGQSVFRTALSKVGMPGADQGLSAEDPTIATLKEQGYAAAQFGKNHFGDLNKFVPTVHGFDEFFGVLGTPGTPALTGSTGVAPVGPVHLLGQVALAWLQSARSCLVEPRFGAGPGQVSK